MVQQTDFQDPPFASLQEALWCETCEDKTPDNMVWYRVKFTKDDQRVHVVAACDACLEWTVRYQNEQRRQHQHAGFVCSPLRVVRL